MQNSGLETSKPGGLGSKDDSVARLRVRLLGAAEVILDGRRLKAFNSSRLQRFLALLALRREPQDRARLAFEFWPESSERQARTNFRKLLHEFRQALPAAEEFVELETGTVQWRSTGPSAIDVLSFRDAIASGDLQRAARLYQGDLLPSCYDDWVLENRARLRAAALGVFRQLAEASAEEGDHRAAVAHAEAISSLDPADERAMRIQLQSFHALGDRVSALRAYQRHAGHLQNELGVEPSAEITALSHETGVCQPGPDRPPASEAGGSPFVGRQLEWRKLFEAWDTARGGRAHLVLLTGEPGIGKSRLVHELGRHARAEGYGVAAARAYEAAGRLPWGPVIDLLRTQSIELRIDALDNVWVKELTKLLPKLGDAASSLKDSYPGNVARRHRLFDAVCHALVGDDSAQMLIIDDLQWCDTETIELLGYLLCAQPRAPLLIAGTVRWEEIPEGHPLPGLVDALQREHAVTVVALDPLDQTSTNALAAMLLGRNEIESGLAKRLWSETEGNPLFVTETIQAGLTSDDKMRILTPTMRSVLRARLDQLTEDAQELAEMAAVFGRSFSASAMVAAMGADEQSVGDLLDELWRRRIVVDRGGKYDFSHDKLREVALEMINPARRRRLHRAVAEALAREHKEDIAFVSAQLATHYDQARMVEQAIDAYRAAGARAVAMSGLDESVTMFSRALALLAELPSSPGRDAIELDIRIALGSPLVAIKGYGAAASHQLYERSLLLCRKHGRPVNPPILRGLGLARLQGCRFDACSEFAQALIDHESGDHVAGTEGRYLMGVSAFWQGDLAKSRQFLAAAIDHYDPAHREVHLARFAQDPKAVCLVRLGLTTLWSGDPGDADTMARSAFEYAGELDHLMSSAYVVTYASILAAVAEDLARLNELLDQAERIWSRLSERYLKLVLEALQGWLDVRNGSEIGIEKILRSVERSRADGENLHLSFTLFLLAQARGLRGELHEGRAATREAIAWSEQCGQNYLVAELLRVDGELAYRLGETDDAQSSLRQAVEVSRAQGAKWLTLKALHTFASRFPESRLHRQLAELAEELPSGHDLPAFRAAEVFLRETG